MGVVWLDFGGLDVGLIGVDAFLDFNVSRKALASSNLAFPGLTKPPFALSAYDCGVSLFVLSVLDKGWSFGGERCTASWIFLPPFPTVFHSPSSDPFAGSPIFEDEGVGIGGGLRCDPTVDRIFLVTTVGGSA